MVELSTQVLLKTGVLSVQLRPNLELPLLDPPLDLSLREISRDLRESAGAPGERSDT